MLLFQSCKDGKRGEDSIVLSDSTQAASCALFTTNNKGDLVISWCEKNQSGNKKFYFSEFDKTSNRFSNKNSIPIEPNASLHEEGMPKVAFKNDGTIIAVFETSEPTEKNRFAGNIKYLQSFDNGINWSSPTCLHADTSVGLSHSFASICRLSNGEIGACWLDESFGTNKMGRSVKFSNTIGRAGFKNEKIIDSFACQCCKTSLSCDSDGKVSILFRDLVSDTIRDVSICNSFNNGSTFSKAYSFTNDNWAINGCPHNGPSVICNNGTSYVTWYTGGNKAGLYYASLNNDNKKTDFEKVTNSGKNIQLCLMPNGDKIIVYNVIENIDGAIYSKIAIHKISKEHTYTSDITSKYANASYPLVHAIDNDRLIVAWQSKNIIYYKLIESKDINEMKNNMIQASNFSQTVPAKCCNMKHE